MSSSVWIFLLSECTILLCAPEFWCFQLFGDQGVFFL
ncbi:hypothetical protein M758_12G048600 [Ceratodon purpureus]|nr:hypothetical protein M758_12G048600 [Ceratodon purpureus]